MFVFPVNALKRFAKSLKETSFITCVSELWVGGGISGGGGSVVSVDDSPCISTGGGEGGEGIGMEDTGGGGGGGDGIGTELLEMSLET